MSTRELLQISLNSIKEKGLARTIQSVMSVIEDFIFDKRYGLNTREIVELNHLDITEDDKIHSYWYQATRLRHFRFLMKELRLPEKSVFVDVGSGKGKVLLMASEYKFERVVGIEQSRELCRIAKSNVSIYKKRKKKNLPIEINEINVLEYIFKDDESIFYFFNPFSSVILEKYLEKTNDSLQRNPREMWLIFNNFNNYYNDSSIKENLAQEKSEYLYGGTEFVVYKTN